MNVQGTVIEYSGIYYKDLSLKGNPKCDPKLFDIDFH